MRPVFVTPHVDAIGGTERQIQLLAPAFEAAGHPVRVVSRTPRGAAPPLPRGCLVPVDLPFDDTLARLRALRGPRPGSTGRAVPTEAFSSGSAASVEPRAEDSTPGATSMRGRLARAARAGLDTLRVVALARRIEALAPSVVHVHGTFSHVHLRAAVRAARAAHVPVVVKVANEPSRVLADLARDPQALAALHEADRIVAVTEGAATALRAVGLPVVVIPNAVTIPVEPHAPRTRGPLLFVGTFKPQKNLSVLLDAYARLPASLRADYPLRLVGDGPARAALAAQAAALGLGASVELPGAQAEIAAELERAARFVLPSAFEGMSNALLEACAAGVPALASDVDGNRDVLGEAGRAGLFAAGDVDALAASLVRSLGEPQAEAERATAVRAAVRARHAPAQVVGAMVALYGSLGVRG